MKTRKAPLTGSVAVLCAMGALTISGCESTARSGSLTQAVGDKPAAPVPAPEATSPAPAPDGTGSTAGLGASCRSTDSTRLCLSLKYVVYKDSSGRPLVSEDDTLKNLEQINSIWSQCGIVFEIGQFLPVTAPDYGLSLNTPTASELGSIRGTFEDATTLLVVTTGTWSGSLGSGSANAWTTMPGGSPLGVVMEESVGTYPNIIAHELGHYLGLDHVSDTGDVMSPVIYASSTALTDGQCGAARDTAVSNWTRMLR
ncbi:MAG: matrixin family metalloprotease [Oligoflexia bacterium]|nr:matrixin family metalloprotease [Oligoflexia bacterium]